MSFTNLYYKRTAGTPKACFVCYRPTPTVLATIQNPPVDFIYVCDSHLEDRGFASLIPEVNDAEAKKPGLSAEEIAKVKAEWEAKQKRKAEKAKEKEKEKEKEKKEDADDKDKKEVERKSSKDSIPSPKPVSPPPPPAPTHKKYALHRDMFALRLSEHRKRRQAAQAKALAPRLPGAPTGGTGPAR